MRAPIVFVHGAFTGGWSFDGFRKAFEAAGFTTHAPDLPGHGPGAPGEQLCRYGVRDYAQSIARFCRDLPERPVLIGHSLGGLVAQIAATQADIRGLVLLASSSPWGVMPTTLEEQGSNLGLAMLGQYWLGSIPPIYDLARAHTLNRLPREQAREIFSRFTQESGRAIYETIHWWLDPSMASAAPAYRISAPVLAIGGGKDRVIPASTVRRIAGRFPRGQASFHEFPALSHWPMDEPEAPEIAALIMAWLAASADAPREPATVAAIV